MDKRQQVYRNIAQQRRVVVPAGRRPLIAAPREVLLAAQKPQVVAVAPVKSLPPATTKPKPVHRTPKRVTIDSFSPHQEPKAAKTAAVKTAAPKQPINYQPQPIQPPTYQQPTYHQPQYQPIPAHPVQSIQYHTHYYAQPAQLPQPIAQLPYPAPAPSQYARAVATAQQQPQLPAVMPHQYPMAMSGGAAALPAAPKPKKSSSVKPYTDSMKRGLSKVKTKLGKPDMKYKPSDIMRYAVVTFFVIMASYLAFDTWNTNQKIQTVVSGDSASASNGQHAASADVENPPMASGVAYPDYKVADDMPRILTIPSINLTARVSEVGLTTANKIDVPGDASFAGWYNGSAKLDTIGASFLTGHYNGVDAGGIFDNLHKIASGATITVEMGDGQKLNYEVVNVENLPIAQVDMSRALSPSEGVQEGLNIMTCQGSWSASGFSHRLTVYSRRV
ncbi:MAG: sortase [Candidatus Nomurabacteria bacterium]|nr:sortase [Candidatus Nomurabacteria bacterium]